MESVRDEMRQRERMMRFAEMKLLGRITLRYTEHKGSLVVKGGLVLNMGFRDFAEIPEGPWYLQEYYLFLYFCRCMDGQKTTDEECISAETLEKRKESFDRLVNKVHETYDDQLQMMDPIIWDYLDKVRDMIHEAERIREIPAIQDTRYGFDSMVDMEVVNFYDQWLETLRWMEKQLH